MGLIFNRKRKIKEKLKELQFENEELRIQNQLMKDELSFKYEQKTIINAFDEISKIQFDFLGRMFERDQVKRIEIQTIMTTGDVDEFTVGLLFAVKMIGFNDKGEEIEYASVPVHETGDGCIYSKYANTRRLNTYELTRSFGDYVEKEVLRGFLRSSFSIPISRTEKKIDALLYYEELNEKDGGK